MNDSYSQEGLIREGGELIGGLPLKSTAFCDKYLEVENRSRGSRRRVINANVLVAGGRQLRSVHRDRHRVHLRNQIKTPSGPNNQQPHLGIVVLRRVDALSRFQVPEPNRVVVTARGQNHPFRCQTSDHFWGNFSPTDKIYLDPTSEQNKFYKSYRYRDDSTRLRNTLMYNPKTTTLKIYCIVIRN